MSAFLTKLVFGSALFTKVGTLFTKLVDIVLRSTLFIQLVLRNAFFFRVVLKS